MTEHEELHDIYSMVSRGLRVEKEKFPFLKKILSLEMLLQYAQSTKPKPSLSESGCNTWFSKLTIWTCLFDSSGNCGIYCELTEACWENSYTGILISCLSEDDMYIRYMCRKVLRSLLNSSVLQSSRKIIIENIVSCVIENSANQHTDYTDLLADLLCRHECSNVNKLCTHILHKNWLSVLKSFHSIWNSEIKNTDDYGCQMTFRSGQSDKIADTERTSNVKSREKDDTRTFALMNKHNHLSLDETLSKTNEIRVCSLLNVWIKLLRRHHDIKDDGDDDVQVIFPSCVVFMFTSMQNPIIFRRTLDLFHEAIGTYGKGLAIGKDVGSQVLELSTSFLTNTKTISLKLPYRKSFVGFGGTDVAGGSNDYLQNYIGDKPMLRKYVLLVLKCCAVTTKAKTEHHLHVELVEKNLLQLLEFIEDKLPNQQLENGKSFKWLIGLFQDQDDTCIESLLTMLDIYLYMSQTESTRSNNRRILTLIDPHYFFLQWLSFLTYNHSVIVDLLVSPETCFLFYIMRYLKCIIHEWSQFVAAHDYFPFTKHEKNKLDEDEDEYACEESCDSLDRFSESDDYENKFASGNSSPGETFEQLKETSSSLDLLQAYNDSSSSESDVQTNVLDDSSSVIIKEHQHENLFFECSRNPTSACAMKTENTESRAENLNSGATEAETHFSCSSTTASMQSPEQKLCDTHSTAKASHTFADAGIGNEQEQTSRQVALDNTMSVLIRTRLKIEKLHNSGIYAYNPSPLLRLITNCEEIYESKSCHTSP